MRRIERRNLEAARAIRHAQTAQERAQAKLHAIRMDAERNARGAASAAAGLILDRMRDLEARIESAILSTMGRL